MGLLFGAVIHLARGRSGIIEIEFEFALAHQKRSIIFDSGPSWAIRGTQVQVVPFLSPVWPCVIKNLYLRLVADL